MVTNEGVNCSLLASLSLQQKIAQEKWNSQFLIVTSGAAKLGRLMGKKNGLDTITKVEAVFRGYDQVMNGWAEQQELVGLKTARLTVTGYDLTKSQLQHHQKVIKSHVDTNFIINTHDGLNLSSYRYHREASNNDVVGEKFAGLCSDIYIIATNVDGIYDRTGRTIRYFNDLEMLNDIEFGEKSESGSGGMETKFYSGARFANSKQGRVTYIVNGNEENILLKVLEGQEVGTRIEFEK